MKPVAITGRSLLTPPPAGWHEHLAQLLGKAPRRIGPWAELGLYGALLCLADAAETRLPADACLILSSRQGPSVATHSALQQMQNDLPMPLTFLQTQPSQLLALLAAQWNWRGNACFYAATAPQALLTLARAQMGSGGVLLGCVDESDGGSSQWLRLRPNCPEKYEFASSFAAWGV